MMQCLMLVSFKKINEDKDYWEAEIRDMNKTICVHLLHQKKLQKL